MLKPPGKPAEKRSRLFVCLSVYLSVYLSVSLSVCLSVCLLVCLLVCLSIYLSVYLPFSIHKAWVKCAYLVNLNLAAVALGCSPAGIDMRYAH